MAVRVDNSLQPASRWYTGSGIYRHVWLTRTDPLRVAHWGTQVSTPKVDAKRAEVAVRTTVRNGHESAKKVTVTQTIVDADGKVLASVSKTYELGTGEDYVLDQALEIANPARWSPESPALYTVRTELRDGDRLADRYETPLGVREFRFNADKGMSLNGESVIMKGMCNHHDLGPLLDRELPGVGDLSLNLVDESNQVEDLLALDGIGLLAVDELPPGVTPAVGQDDFGGFSSRPGSGQGGICVVAVGDDGSVEVTEQFLGDPYLWP